MPVGINAVTTGSGTETSVSPDRTVSHTVAGSNVFMVAGISWSANNAGITIDNVTYNGVNMFVIAQLVNGSINNELWALANPAAGTHNLVATWLLSVGDIVQDVIGVITFTGAASNSAASQATGSDTAPTVNITGVSTNNMILDHLAVFPADNAPTVTVGADQTQRWNLQAGTAVGGTRTVGAGSTEPGLVGVATMSWSLDVGDPWAIQAIEILTASTLKDPVQHGVVAFAR